MVETQAESVEEHWLQACSSSFLRDFMIAHLGSVLDPTITILKNYNPRPVASGWVLGIQS